MQTNYDVPKVEVPGLSEDEKANIEAIREEMEWYERTRSGFLRALFINTRGRPFTGVRKPRRKPTKHQRHMARVKARSAFLKEA